MSTPRCRRLTNAQIDAEFRRRDRRLASEPLASSVRYIPRRDSVAVAYISGRGASLSWPDLDADFTVMSLLDNVYGGKKWMSELAPPARRRRRRRQKLHASTASKGAPPQSGRTDPRPAVAYDNLTTSARKLAECL